MNPCRLGMACLISAVVLSSTAACGGGGGTAQTGTLLIVVNAPFSVLPFVGNFSLQGAQLAADQINARGGVNVAGSTYMVRIEKLDNQLSPATSLDNVRRAIAEHAVAVIDDGYTVDATHQVAQAAGLPILVDYDGNTAIIDSDKRPNVFRIAPPNDAVAQKLVGYVSGKGLRLAVMHDDSEYGRDGGAQLAQALQQKGVTPTVDVEVPSSATDLSAQALQVKQSGATGVLVWARAPLVAAVVKALRQGGVSAAVFGSPTAEDPVVRDQLADHPDWVEGLTYGSFRITTEVGPEPWSAFRKAYEARYGDYKAGVKNGSRDVVQPPDWQIFPYDMVNLVAAATQRSGTLSTAQSRIVDALTAVQITSANGDNRGWKKDNHEAVADDDIYFATFMQDEFKPVQDDALSRSLPPIDQE